MPTSTASRRVARLEAQLSVRLVQRTTRKLSLTDAGQLYYERSICVLAEFEEAESILSQAQSTPKGRVRAAALLEHSITMRLINEFLLECPEVRVDVSFTSRDVNIIEEGYDVAIHAGELTNLSVVAHKLMDSPFSIVASASYLERRGEPRTTSELSKHDCIVFGDSSPEHTGRSAGHRPRSRCRSAAGWPPTTWSPSATRRTNKSICRHRPLPVRAPPCSICARAVCSGSVPIGYDNGVLALTGRLQGDRDDEHRSTPSNAFQILPDCSIHRTNQEDKTR